MADKRDAKLLASIREELDKRDAKLLASMEEIKSLLGSTSSAASSASAAGGEESSGPAGDASDLELHDSEVSSPSVDCFLARCSGMRAAPQPRCADRERVTQISVIQASPYRGTHDP